MSTRIQIRRDTAAAWTSANPVLADGELGWETDTDMLKVGDGVSTWSALSYFAPGGGGGAGVTQSYAGTTSVGGTIETATYPRHYLKKITLASAALLTSVETYLTASSGVHSWGSGVWADTSGEPGRLMAASVFGVGATLHLGTGASWFAQPIGLWLPAGSYWIGGQFRDSNTTNKFQLSYDEGGTDRYQDAGGAWMQGFTTTGATTATTRNYSIRANLIR